MSDCFPANGAAMYAGLRFYPSKTYTRKARPAISVREQSALHWLP